MNAHSSRTFKSGNSEAIRLPKGLGFGIGTEVRIEREGDRLVVTPVDHEGEQVRRFRAMLERMKAMGPVPGPRQERDDIWLPERPKL
jgi:antitoxin VapB